MRDITCRFCGSESQQYFSSTILCKYEVKYFRCDTCECLQTEEPFWLSEAYASNIADDDTGAVDRNLTNIANVAVFCKLLEVLTCLDYGASDGILVRSLRDFGIDAYGFERHASLKYARRYRHGQLREYDLLCAFEVIEHFDNPAYEIEQMRSLNPKLLLFTTGIFQNQLADWPYLAPRFGQHIFFLSVKGVVLLGEMLNMQMFQLGPYLLGVRRDQLNVMGNQLVVMQRLFRSFSAASIRSLGLSINTLGILRDHYQVRELTE